MKAVLIFVLLALVAMVMGQSVNSTVPVINSTVATRGPRGTPGVACKTRTTCGSCFELHTCTWSKTNQCVRIGSKREADLRKQDKIIDACPKTLFLGKTPIVLPDTPVVHEVVPAKMNNGPLDPFEIDVPVVATPDVFEALPIGSTVSRGPNFAFVEVDAEEEADEEVAEEAEEEPAFFEVEEEAEEADEAEDEAEAEEEVEEEVEAEAE